MGAEPRDQSRRELDFLHQLGIFDYSALDSLPAGVIVVDRQHRVVLANKFTGDWVKRSLEEMQGEHCFRLFHNRDDLCPDCPCQVTFETGESATTTHTGLDRDGKPTYAELTTFPLMDREGRVLQVVEYARDVSERVYFQESIVQLNGRLVALNVISTIVSSSLDLDEILHLAGTTIIEVTRSDGMIIGLREPGGDSLVIRAQVGAPPGAYDPLDSLRLKISTGLAGFSPKAGTLGDLREMLVDSASIADILEQRGVRFVALVPLKAKSGEIGLMAVIRREDCEFSREDLDLLTSASNQIGVAVDNASLFQKLKASEATYRNMVEHSNDIICTIDREGNFTWFNRRAEEISDHNLSDWAGKPFASMVVPEDLPKTRKAFATALEGHAQSHEVRVFKKDGSILHLLFNTTPIHRESEVVGVVGFAKDITDRKRAEEELLRRNRQLAALNELSFTVNQSLDLDEVLHRALAKGIEALQLDAGGIYALEETEMVLTVHSGLSPDFVRSVAVVQLGDGVSGQAVSLQRPVAVQVDHYPSQTLTHHLKREGLQSVVSVPLVAGQRILGAMNLASRSTRAFSPEDLDFAAAIGNEIGTAIENARLYRRTDAQLQKTVEELAIALEDAEHERAKAQMVTMVSGDAIMVVDSQRRVVSINPALEALTGYQGSDLLGKPCYKLLNLRDKDGICLCDSICPFVRLGRERSGPLETLVSTALESDTWTELTIGCTGIDQGRPDVVVHTFRDLAKRKEIDRLKDEFLAIATHELKTPITSIKAYAQTILRQLKGSDHSHHLGQDRAGAPPRDLQQKIEGLLNQIDRLVNLVNELLDVSRIQSGRLELRTHPVDLGGLLATVVERARLTTDKHVIILDVPEIRPLLQVDSSRVEQVVTNLVENAIKYSPFGGQIALRMSVAETMAQVSVSDEGVGILEDQRSYIFDRFFQVGNRVSHQYRGLGLGLYISREIIERHGGTIWAEGRAEGGTVFCFTLPLHREEELANHNRGVDGVYLTA